MIDENLFKISFLLLLVFFYVVRGYFSKKYLKNESNFGKFPNLIKILFVTTVVTMILFPLIYIFTSVFDSYSLLIPEEIRILGIVLLFIVIVGMWWILRTLNINFDEDAQNRFVVSSGPYKYIRHPMYLVFIIQALAQGIISANLLVFIGLISIIILIVLRIRYEERLLIQEFGDDYLDYKKETKRIFPKIW